MTQLIIRYGEAVDTLEVDTKAKLMAAIKSGMPDILPGTVTVLIDGEASLINQVKDAVSVDTLWENVRDNALTKAAKMLETGSSMGADGAASIHQLINLARRAEKRLVLGPDNCTDLLIAPNETMKKQRQRIKDENKTMTIEIDE